MVYRRGSGGIGMMPAASGIFPDSEENQPESIDEVAIDINTSENYHGTDGDQVAIDEIDGHITAGHLFSTTSLPEARSELGGAEPVLNKIGIVSKVRARKVKRRMILDTKKSLTC